MTPELKPQDLKVGDVVDVTFRGLEVQDLDPEHSLPVYFQYNRRTSWISEDWLSNATINRSPEVIEAGDTVADEDGKIWKVLSVHADVAWVENTETYETLALSDLTLISKGAKS